MLLRISGFASRGFVELVMGKGFLLGGINIKPCVDAIEGYIPFPPFYLDKTTLDGLLTEYGELRD